MAPFAERPADHICQIGRATIGVEPEVGDYQCGNLRKLAPIAAAPRPDLLPARMGPTHGDPPKGGSMWPSLSHRLLYAMAIVAITATSGIQYWT